MDVLASLWVSTYIYLFSHQVLILLLLKLWLVHWSVSLFYFSAGEWGEFTGRLMLTRVSHLFGGMENWSKHQSIKEFWGVIGFCVLFALQWSCASGIGMVLIRHVLCAVVSSQNVSLINLGLKLEHPLRDFMDY